MRKEPALKRLSLSSKKKNEEDFHAAIGNRLSKYMEVSYVFQDLYNLPEGFAVPEGRVKPWGTGHAVLSCIEEVDGPFAVINADDYYGVHAFQMAYDFLTKTEDTDKYHYMMVGYRLENTLTENGHVARGVCVTDEDGYLKRSTSVPALRSGAKMQPTQRMTGQPGRMLRKADTTVSMNMWGFTASILGELKARFAAFLKENVEKNPLKCEYFLPFVVDELLGEGKADVKVLKSMDKWYGVTYKEDKPVVVAAIQKMKEEGRYPRNLWEDDFEADRRVKKK